MSSSQSRISFRPFLTIPVQTAIFVLYQILYRLSSGIVGFSSDNIMTFPFQLRTYLFLSSSPSSIRSFGFNSRAAIKWTGLSNDGKVFLNPFFLGVDIAVHYNVREFLCKAVCVFVFFFFLFFNSQFWVINSRSSTTWTGLSNQR